MAAACPWCNAPRGSGPECPKCGANYAKAEAIKKQGRAGALATAPAAPVSEPVEEAPALRGGIQLAPLTEPEGIQDPALELKFCLAAIPAMLVLGILFNAFLPFLQRTFLTMPVHEFGHSITAWLCGFWSIPTLWKAITAAERGFVAPLVILGATGFMMVRAWLAQNLLLVALGGTIILLQLVGTLGIKEHTAQMLIVFGGDGLGMILATLLMASFYFGKETNLYKGSLRWGFVAIGAAAFVDMFSVWWATRTDKGRIPFGEMEGTGLSDATKLVDEYGWTIDQLVARHVTVGVLCLLALAAVYAWGAWRAWQAAQARR
jgi:hypothetical protein